MPDILGHHMEYAKKHLANIKNIDQMFPQHKIQCYRRSHELIIFPQKNNGYKLIKSTEEKAQAINGNFEIPKQAFELQPEKVKQFEQINPTIVFLGTGSMKPTKYRNVSSIMVEWTKDNFIMMDCG